MEAKEKPQAQPDDYWVTLERQVREIVSETLATSKAVEELPLILNATVQFLEKLTRDFTETLPPHRPIVCAEGCVFCCTSIEVHASALEVIGITTHLTDHFSEPEIRALGRDIRQTAEAKKAQNGKKSPSSFPCPLLKDGKCQVYPVRPFVCRGFNSYDASACERHKGGDRDAKIDGYVHQDIIAQAALRGVQRGCADCGFDGNALDLTPALAVALETPDAFERWQAGEAVFDTAKARHARGE